MEVTVFTARSCGIGVTTGVLVAVVSGQLIGVSWGLAILTGMSAGALALAVSIGARDGRFYHLGADTTRRRLGIWMLDHLEGNDTADPRLHRVTSPPSERADTS